ncbi:MULTISPECIES: MDR family MFS transporter [Thermoactinomyces]|uniref:MFS transporter n=1 Tax=Thermoactinomyces daqus TaxID=1329516 RepID=A0A7W2AIZ4_9BACL|nr:MULTISPECIES: MDR family MFS transporter [Thermoactinomyces]MBA4543418.1 MFS transporter [Thermoactinomyces daqus]MBH8605217.1 MFS transporter [Thermoactinomyces sp. CICC 10522]MBH8608201.1 MFS transporter [Thermoactinomyces sp. CICC 10521]
MQTNRKQVTIAMLIATFLAAIEVTIVSTAMPRIASELGGLQFISWVFAAYLLTSTVTTPIFGKLADLYGRKVVFTVGAALFLLGSMLSGLSSSMHQLIWFRALQGLGAGGIMPTTFTIIGDIFPYEQRAKVQGWFSSIWGLSGLVGPLVGGFLVDYVSWRWIFYINLPFGLVSVIMLWIFLREEGDSRERKIDYLGVLTFSIAVASILFALSTGGTVYSWGSAIIIGLFLVGILFLLIFIWVEFKAEEPMLPLELFKIPSILVSNLAALLSSGILIALNVYLPLWVQGVHGRGATGSGLTLLPMSIGWPIGATLGGRLMLKVGPRKTAVLGLILILAGNVSLAFISQTTPDWVLSVIMLIIGFGFGFSMTVYTVIVQSSVGWNLRGAATASNTFLRSLGQTIGVAVFGTLFNHYMKVFMMGHAEVKNINVSDLNRLLDPHNIGQIPSSVMKTMREALVYGLHHIFLILVGIAVLALLFVFRLPSSKPEAVAVSKDLKEA